jgi:hypothetical protein
MLYNVTEFNNVAVRAVCDIGNGETADFPVTGLD